MTNAELPNVFRARRPWYHPVALVRWVFLLVLIGYAAAGAYLYFHQTSMIYEGAMTPFTVEAAAKEAFAAGLVPWNGARQDGLGPQGFVQADFGAPAPRGTIVLFHGNGESAWWWGEEIPPLKQRGFRVFLYEYPGFGGRPGVPSERAIVPDARALIRSLAQAGYGPIYLWGESLGSGVAAAVCADEDLPVQGLTLVSPWDNIAAVAQSYYPYLPIRPFMTDRYDSVANLSRFHHSICVIYGDQDSTVPPGLSLHLFAHLPDPKKLMVMRGAGHGDWPRDSNLPWWDEALDFIAPQPKK